MNTKANSTSWKGFKECTVFKIVQEDENVKSFYLNFDDNSKMPEFIAGQFIAVKIKNADGTYSKARQYTLSKNHNDDYYRISVKREPEGDISKRLCDEINEGDHLEISMPMGKFVLKDSDKPLVLLGGGIGVTPMLTMAYDCPANKRDIYFIYSIPNRKSHSFIEEIEELKKTKDMKTTIFYTRPEDSEKCGVHYDVKGRMTKEWIEENLPKDGEYYFCGPVPFMKSLYHNLIDIGITKEQINYELFGPGADITK
ncbi:MAG: oxidoreductase [Clostridium sp.]|nr:oxidoreductase [Clostridium sp.]